MAIHRRIRSVVSSRLTGADSGRPKSWPATRLSGILSFMGAHMNDLAAIPGAPFDDLDLDRPEDEEEWERRVMVLAAERIAASPSPSRRLSERQQRSSRSSSRVGAVSPPRRFVATDSIEENIARVLQRAQAGGHGSSGREIRTIPSGKRREPAQGGCGVRAGPRLRLDRPLGAASARGYRSHYFGADITAPRPGSDQ